jgi:UDP-glucose 4-epimerase
VSNWSANWAAEERSVSNENAAPIAWAGRRVLVAGGAGFLGSNLVHRLIREGASVTVVDRLLPEGGANPANFKDVPGTFHMVEGNVGDEHLMAPLIARTEFLFNLAARTSHTDSMSDPLGDLDANVASQLHLLEMIRRENRLVRIVFAGTRQVYGRPRKLPVTEDHPLNPPDLNAVHKMTAEGYHRLYDRVYGIPSSVLRLTNCYGPRMRVKDARQNFLGIWIRLLLEGKPIEVWGGEQKRDFSFSEDVAEAFLAATQPNARGGVFNVGGEAVSLRQLAELLLTLVEGRLVITDFPPDRKQIDIGDFVADDSAFRAATGWAPCVSLGEGLRRTLAYYRHRLTSYL